MHKRVSAYPESACIHCKIRYVLQVSMQGVGVVTGAAVIANLFESYLGATLQGKAEWLSNDIVNAIQISLAACIALVTTAYLYLPSCCAVDTHAVCDIRAYSALPLI